jgi:medium-chain acyl-[acyl-carrier-protein] hydrolase
VNEIISRVQSRGSTRKLRLFCFPFAGGGASVYRSWSVNLPAWIEVMPIQLPGREERFGDAAFGSVDQMLASIVPCVSPLLDGPYAIWGHSAGGIMAHALAVELCRNGFGMPAHLLIGACRAPAIWDDAPRSDSWRIHSRMPQEVLAAAVARMQDEGSELTAHPELLALVLPTLRADLAVSESWVEKWSREPTQLTCPVSVFAGADDTTVPISELMRWAGVTSGPFGAQSVPGRHFFLRDSEKRLTEAIIGRLKAHRLD